MKYPHRPDYCFSPGEQLSECLGALGLTPAEFARHGDIDIRTVQALIRDTTAVSPEIAAGLERGTRVPAGFWLRCDERYRRFRTCAGN